MTTQQDIKVPGNRIAVLIGKGGAVRRMLEEKTGTTITIDSQDGLVHIEGEDAVSVVRTAELVRAVSRGFSPERAGVLLEDEDVVLDMIDLGGTQATPRQLERLRGRVIGKAGRSREQIEDMTGTMISVTGKTVAIIGLPEQVKVARAAVDMLLEGTPHEAVFSFLDRKRKEAKFEVLDYYY